MRPTVMAEQVTGWIDDLVKKNCALEENVKVLTSVVQDLTSEVNNLCLKNAELTSKLEMLELSNVQNGINLVQRHEEVNPPVTKLEDELKCLKLENLKLSVKFQMKKMWEFVRRELEKKNLSAADDQSNVEKIIMGYVRPKDLVSCRQVSKLWNHEVKHHMEQKLTFHIYGTRLGRIEEFLDCARQSFPLFRSLVLDLDYSYWPKHRKDVDRLFKIHGKSLHNLELNFDKVGMEQDWGSFVLRNILNSLDEIRELWIGMSCRLIHSNRMYYPPHDKKILPNVKTLDLGLNCTNCNLVNLSCHGMSRVFIDLLSVFPNVETLHWWSEDDSTHFIHSLFQVNPPKLQHLFIHSKLDYECAQLITKSGFKLKELHLVDFESFGLHLVSEPGQSVVIPKLPIYFSNQLQDFTFTGQEIKTRLELVLAKCGVVSCTTMLQVFVSGLEAIYKIGRTFK